MLSDADWMHVLARGQIRIAPFDPAAVQPASIDLPLGSTFWVFDMPWWRRLGWWLTRSTPHLSLHVDPRPFMRQVEIGNGKPFTLKPHGFVLAQLACWLAVGSEFVLQLEGRSSAARLGIRVHDAGLHGPGWDGYSTLELHNEGVLPVDLYPGDCLCQATAIRLETPAAIPYGDPRRTSHYQHQTGATPALAWEKPPPDDPAMIGKPSLGEIASCNTT